MVFYTFKEPAVNGRCCQKNLVLVQHTCHRRFQEWTVSKVFQKLWLRLLEVYDDIKGIRRWTWQQSLDSISVKAL